MKVDVEICNKVSDRMVVGNRSYSTINGYKLLNCCQLNARSIKNKLPELHYLLYCSDVDCVFITESWLSDDFTDGLLDPNEQFTIFRKDRCEHSGGGVCVLIRRQLQAKRVNLSMLDLHVELLCVDIFSIMNSYRFFIAYRPPDNSCVYDHISCHDYMRYTVDCIERYSNSKGPTFVVGDFNCPDINWNSGSMPSNGVSLLLYTFATVNGFVQAVGMPTRGKNLVDLVLINQPLYLSAISVEQPFSSSDHNTVSFNVLYDCAATSSHNKPQRKYLWKKGDYKAMSQYLCSYDWSHMMSTNFTADDLWGAFCAVLNAAVDLFVPHIVLRDKLRHRLYKYPRSIRVLFTRKQCLWRQLRSSPNDVNLTSAYKRLVHECRVAVRNFECERETRVIESQNIGTFYKYVNKRLYNSNVVPVLQDSAGSHIFTDYDKAELFNSFFNSVNVDDDGKLPEFPQRTQSRLDIVHFTSAKIYRVVRKLKAKLTGDPEGYSPYLVKQLVSTLADPLAELFSSFMSVGQIPTSWKKAIITPIYKKGPSSDPANYRPVSLTSVFGKVMERIVATDVLDYLLRGHLLGAGQHGFLSKRSTLTNLIETINDWTISIENKCHTRVAYIDFSRAFDSVSHSKLLHKLTAYGIEGSLLQWIADFLSERSHCTRVGEVCSSYQQIRSGVVQGSCLGPLLFLIFINDLEDTFHTHVKCKLYADDVKLYTEVKSVADEKCFQDCLDSVYLWSQTWQLSVSSKKCCILEVGPLTHTLGQGRGHDIRTINCTLGDEQVSCLQYVADLGITIDSSLKFSCHINTIVTKAHTRANLILRCFRSHNVSLLVKAFNAYVRPALEYGSVTWSPWLIKDITALESVQRRFTKRLPGMKDLTYHQRLSRLGMDSLELRRVRADLIFMYKLVFGLIDVDTSNLFVLRSDNICRGHQFKLYLPHCKTAARYNFLNHRVSRVWNSLSGNEVDFASLGCFKSSLSNSLLIRHCKLHFA